MGNHASTCNDSVVNQPSPDAIAGLMSQADELSMRGQPQAAASAWQRVLDLRPGHAPALNHLGTQAMNRGEHALAQDYFTPAIARAPKLAMPPDNLTRPPSP